LLEVVGGDAGGIELTEQGERLATHCLLDEGQLGHLRRGQCVTEPRGLSGDATGAAGALYLTPL
jgi:hypothetical protein